MKLLAIETASDACSVALWLDGEKFGRFEISPRMHNELVTPMLTSVLAEAGCKLSDLDALAFGRGPGSFTGVRIAASYVQGLSCATGLPVVPVSSLQTVAQGIYRLHGYKQVIVAFDARLAEVYWGAFALDDQGIMQSVRQEAVEKPVQIQATFSGDWMGAGKGWGVYGQILQERLGAAVISRQMPDVYPDAQDVASLAVVAFSNGLAVRASDAVPVYLRDQVVSVSVELPKS